MLVDVLKFVHSVAQSTAHQRHKKNGSGETRMRKTYEETPTTKRNCTSLIMNLSSPSKEEEGRNIHNKTE